MNRPLAVAAMVLLGGMALIGCSSEKASPAAALSRGEVEQIVEAELARAPTAEPGVSGAEVEQIVEAELAQALTAEPGVSGAEVQEAIAAALEAAAQTAVGLTRADLEAAVAVALANMASPEPGVTSAEVEEMVRYAVASIPPRSDSAAYTEFVVDNAISRYETDGLEATVDHYNRKESIDGQWYVFIVDDNDEVIGHHNPDLLGLDLKGPVGTDVNGYNFGPEMLAATEDGKWVTYVYRNPETGDIGSEDFGDLQLKNAWVVRHDGMLFGSGWYIDADEHTKSLVAVAVDKFRTAGLAGTIEYFASPQSATAGLRETIDYYNSAESIEGQWLAFIADNDGKIVAHPDPEMLGTDLQALLGAAASRATADGSWVTTDDIDPSTGGPESMRVWMVTHDGMTFGAGWYNDGTD